MKAAATAVTVSRATVVPINVSTNVKPRRERITAPH
jgi:hypothetical protein